jgi:hypothetical protein
VIELDLWSALKHHTNINVEYTENERKGSYKGVRINTCGEREKDETGVKMTDLAF